MKKIFKNLTELIGQTPLLELGRIEKEENLKVRLLVKLERQNPGGSVKDRIALAMIEDAEQKGTLQLGGTIIEPTSGNTGVGIAWVAAARGYKAVIVMPETMSVERRNLMRALGVELVLTLGSEGMKGAIARAEALRAETPGSIILGQFDNPANPAVHSATTAEEIWADTEGSVDVVVAGVGTGGTISGIAERLKEKKPGLKSVAVEPASSAVLSGNPSGAHKIQGIGAGFVPKNFHGNVVDEILPVSDEDAVLASRLLARKEGLLVGISSGAAFAAALQVARRADMEGKTIVAVLPDTGERYLSTVLYDFEGYPA